MSTLRLFVIRHGATEWSRGRRFAGTRDIPLSALGLRQSEAVASLLAAVPAAAVYASPLERARTSAEMIAKPHRLAVQVEPAFREMGFGEWEGLTRAEVDERFPALARRWQAAPHEAVPPGGEPLLEVAARVEEALDGLKGLHAGETVIVVTHAIVTRLIVLAALRLDPAQLWAVDASPAGLSEIEYELAPGSTWATLHRMNTVSHLDGLD